MTKDIVIPRERLNPLVSGNKTFRSFYDIRVSEEDLKRANSELGETEEIRNVSLQKLKEDLKKDKTTQYRMDDAYLLRFLRYRKFDCDSTYKHIRKFYSFRKERPDLFTVPPNFEFLMNMKMTKVLPYRDEEGSIIFWMDFRNWHLGEFCPVTASQMITAVAEVISLDPSCQINGAVGLWDLRGSSSFIPHLVYPWLLIPLVRCLQDCYPWRLKKIVCINSNKILQSFYASMKYLLKKKIRDRIVILGQDLTELKNHINPLLLPTEYGGSVEEEDCIYTEFMMNNIPYIEYERSFK